MGHISMFLRLTELSAEETLRSLLVTIYPLVKVAFLVKKKRENSRDG